MSVNTNKNITLLSDANLVEQIGKFIKHHRTIQQKTQLQLAADSGLNRWTVSQIENGQAISLTSLIQLLRALHQLQVLETFQFSEEISPLAYAKLKKKKQRQRVRQNKTDKDNRKEDLGW